MYLLGSSLEYSSSLGKTKSAFQKTCSCLTGICSVINETRSRGVQAKSLEERQKSGEKIHPRALSHLRNVCLALNKLQYCKQWPVNSLNLLLILQELQLLNLTRALLWGFQENMCIALLPHMWKLIQHTPRPLESMRSQTSCFTSNISISIFQPQATSLIAHLLLFPHSPSHPGTKSHPIIPIRSLKLHPGGSSGPTPSFI